MLYRPRERVLSFGAVADVLHLRCLCRRDRHLVAVVQRRYRTRRAFRDRYRVALIAVRDRVLVLRVLCTVVLPAAVRRFDLQFRRVLRDFQRAFRRGDLVVLRKRAFVQFVRERVRAAADFRLAARNIIRRTFAIDEAVAADRYVALLVLRQRRAVVLLLAVCTRQRYRTRRDLKITVRVFALRVARFMLYRPGERVLSFGAVADVRHLRCLCRRDRHLVAVCQRRYRTRRAFRDRYRVALIAVRDRVLVLRVLCTVVLPAAVRRFDLQFRRVLRDFQRAFRRGDLVVLRKRAFVQFVRERVLAAADFRLTARYIVRRSFAVDKAVAADRHCVVRQRRAVVLLLIVCTRKRYTPRRDL